MRVAAAHRLTALLAVTVLSACETGYDTLTNVESMCDVVFEAGQTVQVFGEFVGERYHHSFFSHPACPERQWQAGYSDDFGDRFRRKLELGNALFIGAGIRAFDVEVEGLLVETPLGPAIEFRKLGNAQRFDWPRSKQSD